MKNSKNREVDSLEFLHDGDIKVYYRVGQPEILKKPKLSISDLGENLFNHIDNYIKTNGDRVYGRLIFKDHARWYNQQMIEVPKTTGHRLEEVLIKIKNILNE